MRAVPDLDRWGRASNLPERSEGMPARGIAAGFPSFDVALPAPADAFYGRNPFGRALRARDIVRPECGTGHRDYLWFSRGLQVAHSRFRLSVDSTGTCNGQNLFKMHFNLAGLNTLRYAGQADHVLRGPCLSMSLQPADVIKLDCHSRDVLEHSLTFACRPDFLADSLSLDPDVLPPVLARFVRGLAPELLFVVLPLPSRAVKLIEELLSPVCSERMAHLHAEARVLDLLCLGLDLLLENPERSRQPLAPRDKRALQQVRESIEKDFLQPTSIVQRAREVGLNRTKLTAGFRALFGETINECVTRLRMQHARQMLEDGWSAAQVAMDLGYQHQSSFSTAFRAYFGHVPRASRKGCGAETKPAP